MAETTSLPPLNSLTQSPENLTNLLSLLFEPSPPLHSHLVPSVYQKLTKDLKTSPPNSYNSIINICETVAEQWTWSQKAEFLSGHPMIGEVKGLSALSGKEQGGKIVTPQIVLRRLTHLNELYNVIYPGLRYITFVNGRPRSAIIPELEKVLMVEVSPLPLPNDYPVLEPGIESEEVRGLIKDVEGLEWKEECLRGLKDVWRIGRARLKGLGVE